jgi:hypothetical protein
MKRVSLTLSLGLLLSLLGANVHAGAYENESLEPCINGQVSASGLYPTQAQEDRARRDKKSMAGIARGSE